ncbi:uncharacterized protein LOC117101613 [Anneissia japonica]|uniref:uncharacterized protein LOC117101613 n=1 Tax=Anneissia japonica TaxID=1529436 RepID=UPI0014255BD1|nr:uncharacterized protein LOC117101613 [Anneissia japonica]
MAGRPGIEFDIERAKEMIKLQFTIADIARDFGVSRTTVYRHLNLNGHEPSKYTDITNQELEMVVDEIKKSHPNAGEVYLMGHLRSRGIRVQRARLRKALQAVDPTGVQRRRTRTITRRIYSVPCPNYLWHIDGTHKMIRWKFVIHAGIDGFSRLITYLHCSDNNTAETVSRLFESAVDRYGLPIRVRSDHGGENQGVWEKMFAERGETNNPVIVGSSVHNERVERLNYDINNQVVSYFKCIFQELERDGLLDPDNATDLFCLHYVFLPIINKHLHEFEACHNNHNISTEGNRTPIQLFYSNQHLIQLHENQQHTESISAEELLNLNLTYVNVYSVGCPLTREQLDELERDYPHDSDMNAKEMYKSVAEYVSEHLH